jgi:hypothetical protein
MRDEIIDISQRCEWNYVDTKDGVKYQAKCKEALLLEPYPLRNKPYCPYCGKRIEVKDEVNPRL